VRAELKYRRFTKWITVAAANGFFCALTQPLDPAARPLFGPHVGVIAPTNVNSGGATFAGPRAPESRRTAPLTLLLAFASITSRPVGPRSKSRPAGQI
jgi:hypothetical protein